ncbi:unnamed protein product [Peniophora sp. CBMAI 1063]|nr:unnamed protein product [Peniophora sp. CBMAI 1063]
MSRETATFESVDEAKDAGKKSLFSRDRLSWLEERMPAYIAHREDQRQNLMEQYHTMTQQVLQQLDETGEETVAEASPAALEAGEGETPAATAEQDGVAGTQAEAQTVEAAQE